MPSPGEANAHSLHELSALPLPGFGEKCTPGGQCTFGARLQDDERKLLPMSVKSQAERMFSSSQLDFKAA
ncbi:Cytochrome c6 [Nymphaea thermarum]|nr:Cytochrome c6 [Nymphaea thermarum]